MKKKILLLCAFLVFATVGCKDDCNPPKPPKWELPQPIDTLLLGSWELIEGSLFGVGYIQVVTFYENNKYILKITDTTRNTVTEHENYWSVNGDTLVMLDFYDSRTGHFADYKYNFSNDGKLLYVELIDYPFVGNCDFTLELIVPLIITKGTFKKLEVE